MSSSRSARRRHVKTRGPVWLFDLDNTLHHASHEIFPAINRAMTQYIIDRLGVDIDEANRLRVGYTVRYGATLLGLVRHHGIDPADFLREVHTFPDLPSMLRAERGLKRIVRALPGRKIVLTNGPTLYARSVLAELGIGKLFERVIAIEDMRDGERWRAKPDAPMLRRAMRRAHVHLKDAILVEDTRGHLKRYRRLGIRTVWIVGHLPMARTSSGGISQRLPGSGRPHYVDRTVRSLRALTLGMRGGGFRAAKATTS
ncbi:MULTISPECIES: pyrimidine 5'-nucleotidase [unclassified Caballeronia]|jgi:pyrimidine 5'-nucleotidase|uniref:pyrimidine 5'-nucleotidase n=1 Tax=unclassified Caballeronia TaxID=2646786 RepID=UPI0020290D52|nr:MULTISPECIES: pyrimidine 5'-nucleotidase [unclassified Caballeronia]MDR5770249.1 pyrimidine 5'-nucleotidase [Caballeronia sp. LZ002]MDR5803352.1 pyrimidine 5'-nucleotidase [Caballeronia sp. LZ001]MDR5845686.1 pyrimidine 5'-nucleotidase [Caballeronia sp. LZ003]